MSGRNGGFVGVERHVEVDVDVGDDDVAVVVVW